MGQLFVVVRQGCMKAEPGKGKVAWAQDIDEHRTQRRRLDPDPSFGCSGPEIFIGVVGWLDRMVSRVSGSCVLGCTIVLQVLVAEGTHAMRDGEGCRRRRRGVVQGLLW